MRLVMSMPSVGCFVTQITCTRIMERLHWPVCAKLGILMLSTILLLFASLMTGIMMWDVGGGIYMYDMVSRCGSCGWSRLHWLRAEHQLIPE